MSSYLTTLETNAMGQAKAARPTIVAFHRGKPSIVCEARVMLIAAGDEKNPLFPEHRTLFRTKRKSPKLDTKGCGLIQEGDFHEQVYTSLAICTVFVR